MKNIRKAVFPVGGRGTRFLPATKSVPKEMLSVAAKPLIQYAYEEALEAGIEEFIFITGRNKNAINNHFNHAYELQSFLSKKEQFDTLAKVKSWLPKAGNIVFIPQQEPFGLGHAVWCARNVIGNEPFAVILADEMVLDETPALKQMLGSYKKVKSNIIAVAEVARNQVQNYGIIAKEQDISANLSKIKTMVEKPDPSEAPSNLSITGRYILQPEIFDYLEKVIKNHDGKGEIQLTDAMAFMAKKHDFYAHKLKGQRFDCGVRSGFLEANIAYEMLEMGEKAVKDILRKYI